MHPLITPLKSEFRVFYLDDGTIGGPKEVLQDLQYIECQAAHLGLFEPLEDRAHLRGLGWSPVAASSSRHV